MDYNIIQRECEDLQSQYNALQKDLYLINQQLVSNETQYSVAKNMESHYMHEIDLLKMRTSMETDDLEHKIKHLKVLINEETTNECTNFENEVFKYQDELTLLESYIDEGKDDEKLSEVCIDESLLDLKNMLEDHLTVSILERDEIRMQNTIIKNNFTNIQAELEQLREKCNSNDEEIIEAETVFNNLEEELILTKNEITSLKPALGQAENDDNSLFAEVNDRRVELRKSMELMKRKYCDIKNETPLVQNFFSNIKFRNEELINYEKSCINETEKDLLTLGDAYVSRIRVLQQICKEYNKYIQLRQNLIENGLPYDTLEFLDRLEKEKSKLIATLENEKGIQFRAQKMMSLKLKEVQLKTNEARMIHNQLQPKLLELTNTIQALKNHNNEVYEVAEAESTDNKENRVNSGILQKDKENAKAEIKKVTFTDDTAQMQKNTIKRGGKKIQLKSVHISHFMKNRF